MDYANLIKAVHDEWVRCVTESMFPHGMGIARVDAIYEIMGRHVADMVLASASSMEEPLARLHAAITVEEPHLCTLTIGLADAVVRRTVMGRQPVIDVEPDYQRHVIERMVGHAASIIMDVPFEKPTLAADGTLLFLQWRSERLAALTIYFNQEPYFTAMGSRMAYTAEAVWEPTVPQCRTDAVATLTMEDFL